MAEPTTDFAPIEGRDAWATIRGFVFQVELTIERWAELTDEQTLCLECGEDIDLVTQVLRDDGLTQETQRRLEQVKQRSRKLTLASPEAVAAVAFAVESHRLNPTLNLLHRFSTNATVARERGRGNRGGAPGIELWNSIQTNTLALKEAAEACALIKSVLMATGRPKSLPVEIWNRFREWRNAAPDSEWMDLICRFQWCMGLAAAWTPRSALLIRLQSMGFAASQAEAEAYYDKLFVEVFRRLSASGEKRLTRKEFVDAIQAPALSAGDQAIISYLQIQASETRQQIDALGERIDEQQQWMESLRDEIVDRKYGRTAESFVFSDDELLLSTPPCLVEHGVDRSAAIAQVLVALRDSPLVTLRGEPGCGKTQLAAQVARRFGACVWLRLRDHSAADIPAMLLRMWRHAKSLTQCGPNDVSGMVLLVLDDLARLEDDEKVGHALVSLCRKRDESKVKILATTHFVLPPEIVFQVGGEEWKELKAPDLNVEEASAIAIATDAPPRILDTAVIQFLVNTCRCHFATYTACLRFLAARGWDIDGAGFDAVLQGDHTAELTQRTLRQIRRTVTDEKTVDLLFRLSLVIGRFGQTEAQLLAAVTPEVAHPHGRIAELAGLWVQAEEGNRYSVATLVSQLNACELNAETKQRCHRALAEEIIKNGRLNPYTARNAVLYSAQAQDFDQAGSVLVMGLKEWLRYFKRHGAVPNDDGFTEMWIGTPLPAEMSISTQLMIRGLQIEIHRCLRKPHDFLWDALDHTLSQATSADAPFACLASFYALMACGRRDSDRAFTYGRSFLKHKREAGWNTLLAPKRNESKFASAIVWSLLPGCRTKSEVEKFVRLACELPENERGEAFDSRSGSEGCRLLFEQLILTELARPVAEREWKALADFLWTCGEKLSSGSLTLLQAACLRTWLFVKSDFLKERKTALLRAQKQLSQVSCNFWATAMLHAAIGEQWLYQRDHSQAMLHLQTALDSCSDVYGGQSVRIHLLLSRAVGDKEPELAISHCERAVDTAENHSAEVARIEAARSLAELGVARWLGGQPMAQVYQEIEAAVDVSIRHNDESNAWKSMFVTLGHSVGYLASIARIGVGPDADRDGNVYAAPRRGLFFKDTDDVAELYQRDHPGGIALNLATFAVAVNNLEGAKRWSMEAADRAEDMEIPQLRSFAARAAVPWLVLANNVEDAVGIAFDCTKVSYAGMLARNAGVEILSRDFDVSLWLGSTGSEARIESERWAVLAGVVPAMLHVESLQLLQDSNYDATANELIAVCERLKRTGDAPPIWEKVLTSLRMLFKYGAKGTEVIAEANRIRDELNCFAAAMYVIASVRPQTSMENALSSQLTALPVLVQLLQHEAGVVDLILGGLIADFWIDRFRRARFTFRSPNILAKDFDLAEQMPRGIEQAKAILRAVSSTSTLQIGSELQSWLT